MKPIARGRITPPISFTLRKFSGIICFTLLPVSALSLQSCRQNIDIPTPASRNYVQDADVINRFVDFNSNTYEFYINPNKRSTVLSYITHADAEELNKVNPLNLDRFKQRIAKVNQLAGSMASSGGLDYIVMMTESEVHISRTDASSPILLEEGRPDTRYQFTARMLKAEGGKSDMCGISGTRWGISIDLDPSAYDHAGWAFLLTCTPEGGDRQPVNILFCGVGDRINPCFELETTTGTDAGGWKCQVTNVCNDGHVANLFISRL